MALDDRQDQRVMERAWEAYKKRNGITIRTAFEAGWNACVADLTSDVRRFWPEVVSRELAEGFEREARERREMREEGRRLLPSKPWLDGSGPN